MLRKYLLIPALLGIAGLLMAADPVQAQRRGGARGGHVAAYRGGGYGHGYGGHGYYGRGYYGREDYGRGYFGGGYLGIWPYLGSYGDYWPGYYSSYQPYWNSSYPYVDTYPYYTYEYAPVTPYYSQMPASYATIPANNGKAEVEVILPDPQAQVTFNGVLMHETGTDRVFTTPVLTSSGTYDIKASWMVAGHEITQDRVISVAPNETTVADFTQPVGG